MFLQVKFSISWLCWTKYALSRDKVNFFIDFSLHKTFSHPYVVKMLSYFDDTNFVYIILGNSRVIDFEVYFLL